MDSLSPLFSKDFSFLLPKQQAQASCINWSQYWEERQGFAVFWTTLALSEKGFYNYIFEKEDAVEAGPFFSAEFVSMDVVK